MRVAIVRADPLGRGQFMAHHFARQPRIERFATPLLTGMARHSHARAGLGRGHRVNRGGQRLGFVEQAQLPRGARLAGGAEQFVLVGPQTFLGQVSLRSRQRQFAAYPVKLTAQAIAFGDQGLIVLGTECDGLGRLRHQG